MSIDEKPEVYVEPKKKLSIKKSTIAEVTLFIGIAIGVAASYYIFNSRINSWITLERMLYNGARYEITKIKEIPK